MPILNDILDHEVLGREFKKGLQEGRQVEAVAILRRLIEQRFGALPEWAEARITSQIIPELESLSLRILKARSLEELFQ